MTEPPEEQITLALAAAELAQSIDWAPTFLELAGAAPPPEYRMNGRSLAPLLGLIGTVQGMIIAFYQTAHLPDGANKAQALADWGVDTLVCGAVSRLYTEMLATSAIKTIAFIAGGIEDIIAAFLGGRLHHQDYRMPGCRRCCNQSSRTGRTVGRRKTCRTASEE